MAGTLEYLKSLSTEMRSSEAHDIAIHYADHLLRDEVVRAYLRTLPATQFEIGTIDLASVALSDLACEVRITWTADGQYHDPEAEGMCEIRGVATVLIDDDGVLRFTSVKPSMPAERV